MIIGQDGAIANFMDDISDAAKNSNGCVIELGPGMGTGSTIAIQNGLKDHPAPQHISVDIRDYMEVKPQVEWWHLVIGDSRHQATVEAAFRLMGQLAGLIFIDTEHTGAQITWELTRWLPLAGQRCVWLFHDVYMFGKRNDDMVNTIQQFADKHNWIYDDFRTEAHGLGRMRR
jgi:Methyltransferase domain